MYTHSTDDLQVVLSRDGKESPENTVFPMYVRSDCQETHKLTITAKRQHNKQTKNTNKKQQKHSKQPKK